MNNLKNSYLKNTNLKNPINSVSTDIINSWVLKMSLCMLLLAGSILFYRYDTGISIPLKYRKQCSISLIFLTCFLGILASYEFYITINDIINNYEKIQPILYSINMLSITRFCYIIAAILFICTCVFMAYLMLVYSKSDKIPIVKGCVKNLR